MRRLLLTHVCSPDLTVCVFLHTLSYRCRVFRRSHSEEGSHDTIAPDRFNGTFNEDKHRYQCSSEYLRVQSSVMLNTDQSRYVLVHCRRTLTKTQTRKGPPRTPVCVGWNELRRHPSASRTLKPWGSRRFGFKTRIQLPAKA